MKKSDGLNRLKKRNEAKEEAQSITTRYLRGMPSKFLPLEEEIRIGFFDPDHQDRWKLVLHNMKFIVSMAMKYFYTHPNISSNPDFFFDNARDGAIKASKLYRGEHGFRFTTFAFWHIRKEMQRAFIKKNGGFSELVSNSLYSENCLDDSLKNSLTVDSIYEPFESLFLKQRKEIILRKINELPDRHKIAVLSYFYEDKKGKKIAEELGVTIQRVSQILIQSKMKLSKKLIRYNLSY